MALIHLPSQQKDSFGKRFSNTFNPALQKGLERYQDEQSAQKKSAREALLEQEKEKRQTKAEIDKEEREEKRRKASSKALGLPEEALEPSVQAAAYKEQQSNARNNELLKYLGIASPSGDQNAQTPAMQSLGNQPGAPINVSQEQPAPQGGPQAPGKFNLLQVPDEAIAAISLRNPALANTIQTAKKQAQDEAVRREEVATKAREREEDIERKPIEKATESYFNKISENKEKIPSQRLSVETMKDAVKRNDIGFFSSPHIAEIAEAFGAPKEILTGLQNPGSKAYNGARKTLLGNVLKDLFKGTTTKGEIGLAESILGEVGVLQSANQAALFLLDAELMIKEEELRLFDEGREQGVSAYKIQNYVDKNLKPFREQLTKEYLDAVKALSKKE